MTGDRSGARGHDHSKSGARFFETTAEHEAVTGFEQVEEGGHAGERKLTNKYGGVQAGVVFFAVDCNTASGIGVWKSCED